MNQDKFTEEDWARVERDTQAWWQGELERPLVYLSVTGPHNGNRTWGYLTNYPLEMPAEAIVDRAAPSIEATRYYGDAFPWTWLNFGPGIIAAFLGAQVNSVTEPSETVWFRPVTWGTCEDFQLSYDSHNIWWQRVQAVTRAFAERYGRSLVVGHTSLGGNLDILASLTTTEQLLFDCVERPDIVVRQAKTLTCLWLRYYDELYHLIRPAGRASSSWVPLLSPGKTIMLQCDFSYMISPKMFERFVLPDLITCCDHLDHAFYHMDGKGEIPHLKHLLSIELLRGIQWIPGDGQPSPDQWLDLLKRIRDAGKLCQVYVSAEGARHIVKNLGGKGFLFVINHQGTEFQNPEVAKAFIQTLAEDGR